MGMFDYMLESESSSSDSETECDPLSQFIKNLDPENPVIPDDFDPTQTIRTSLGAKSVLRSGQPTFDPEMGTMVVDIRYLAPMNLWIIHHPMHRVPDQLMYPVARFINTTDIVSPLSTWIEFSKSTDIPEYLLNYLEVDRVKSRYISCLMTWVECRTDEIPDALLKEIDFRKIREDHDYLCEVNVAGSLIQFRETEPLHPDFHHLLDDFMDDDNHLSMVVKHWLRCHKDEPVPTKFLHAIEQRIRTFDYHVESLTDTILYHYRYYRPDDIVPGFLYKEKPFYTIVTEIIDYKLFRASIISNRKYHYILDALIECCE